jgi:hypothetical protein
VTGGLQVACAILLAASGCASQPRRTIEPPAQGAADEDREFVLSRQPVARPDPDALPPIHPEPAWWPFRAQFLKISEQQARTRDAAISDREAPAGFWDEQTAVESVNLWSALCNECHGGRRRVSDALGMPEPPRLWGRGEGLFFGKRRPYGEIFGIVWNGGPEREGEKSEMPPWRGKIAREQVWALLYFLEYQSGGIEGRFPPSLYPRRDRVMRALE